MAVLVPQFTITVPANTPRSSLFVGAINLSNYEIESVDIEVPPGPQGLMGFYIARSGQQYIPYTAGEFIVWDDRADSWYLTDQPTGGGWQLVAYNLDAVHTHAVVTRWHVNPLSTPTPTPVGPTIISAPIETGAVVL